MTLLPMPEFGKRGHQFGYQLPFHTDELSGLYLPAIDGVYIADQGVSTEKLSVTGPIDSDGDSLFDKIKEKANKSSVFQHELGHAILTNRAITRSNIFTSQFLFTNELSRLIAEEDLGSKLENNEISEYVENMLVQTIHNHLFVSFQKKTLKPVHETFALITELLYCEKDTPDAILEEINSIDKQLGRSEDYQSYFGTFLNSTDDNLWSLSHPGYNPLAYSSEEQVEEWTRFVNSYQRSCLMISWFVFKTLDEEFAHKLFWQAARSAVYMSILSEEDVSDNVSRAIPTILFADASLSFYSQRYPLWRLRDIGVKDDTIKRIYQEWLSFGSIGLEKVEYKIVQSIPDIVPGKNLPSYKRTLQRFQRQIRETDGPSIAFIEDAESNELGIYHNPDGLPLLFIFFTLLRWRLLECIQETYSKESKPDFFANPYDDLFKEFANRLGGADLDEYYFRNMSALLDWCYDVQRSNEIVTTAVSEYSSEFNKSGWNKVASELSETNKISSLIDFNPKSIPQKLTFFGSLPPNQALEHADSFSPIINELLIKWRQMTMEKFISETISSISQFSGVGPKTSRIRRLSKIIEEVADSIENREKFIGEVYGGAVGNMVDYLPFRKSDQWFSRIYNSFEMSVIQNDLDIASIISFNTEVYSTYLGNLGNSSYSNIDSSTQLIVEYTIESSKFSHNYLLVLQSTIVECIKDTFLQYPSIDSDEISLLISYLRKIRKKADVVWIAETCLSMSVVDLAVKSPSDPSPHIIHLFEIVLTKVHPSEERDFQILVRNILVISNQLNSISVEEEYSEWIKLLEKRLITHFDIYAPFDS